jgi:hypothetical protein
MHVAIVEQESSYVATHFFFEQIKGTRVRARPKFEQKI